MLKRLFIAAAAIAAGVIVSTSAFAQTVQRSNGTFHVSACAAHHGTKKAKCHAQLVTDGGGAPLAQANVRKPPGFGPADLRSAYDISAQGQKSTVVAIVDAYGYSRAEEDLATYRKTFGLPECTTANRCFRKVNQLGQASGYPADDLGWSQETALDLEMVSAICPDCKIILVEANSDYASDLGSAVDEAVVLGAKVISNSYGLDEGGTQSLAPAYDHPGVTIVASTGDEGYGVNFPASAPTVIAVGGTGLYRSNNKRGWDETAWSGAGSGCSTVFPKPAWQTDRLCSMRMVADVSAVADPSTPVAVFGPANANTSAWLQFGGTSVAAPLVAGVYALHGGNAEPGSLYTRTRPFSLHDVRSGENGSCGLIYFCKAGPGYDGPTGLGTPQGRTAF